MILRVFLLPIFWLFWGIFNEFEAVIWNIMLSWVFFVTKQFNVSPEPSAELLMNISRSRRLIVLLSHAYLEQDWCTNNFRSDKLNASKGFFFLNI